MLQTTSTALLVALGLLVAETNVQAIFTDPIQPLTNKGDSERLLSITKKGDRLSVVSSHLTDTRSHQLSSLSGGSLFAPEREPAVLALVETVGDESVGAPHAKDAEPSRSRQRQPVSRKEICETLETASDLHDLPMEFLTRLIWQESRFNPEAVSPAGARGIAQFMPGTAIERGLADPFDPIESIWESAGFLYDLRQQMGNLGLAAAAYNAGPGRVQAWREGRSGLPRETQNYVRIVTGHAAKTWTSSDLPDIPRVDASDDLPCEKVVDLIVASAKTIRIAGPLDYRASRGKLAAKQKLADRKAGKLKSPARIKSVAAAAKKQRAVSNDRELSASKTRGLKRAEKAVKMRLASR